MRYLYTDKLMQLNVGIGPWHLIGCFVFGLVGISWIFVLFLIMKDCLTLRYKIGFSVFPLWKSDSFLWISDKKQIHLLKISDKKQTQPYKKSDNFNCFPAAFWLHRKRFFSWPFFGVLSHLVDLYLISNEEPSKGKKQIYLQCEGKSCSITSRFAC